MHGYMKENWVDVVNQTLRIYVCQRELFNNLYMKMGFNRDFLLQDREGSYFCGEKPGCMDV